MAGIYNYNDMQFMFGNPSMPSIPYNGFNSMNFNPVFNYNSAFNPMFSFNNNYYGGLDTFSLSSSSSSSSPSISASEYKKKRAAEIKKAGAERAAKQEQEMKNAPLTSKEREALENSAKQGVMKKAKLSEGSVAPTLIGAGAMATPSVVRGLRTDKSVVNTFITKENAALYKSHADVMINAQEAASKLERNFAKDLKFAAGDAAKIADIETERLLFREEMSKALTSKNPNEIAKVTAEFNAASSVKNGRMSRLLRRIRGKDNLVVSRLNHTDEVIRNGSLEKVSSKAGSSFWKNLGGKAALKSTGLFTILNLVGDKDTIKEAYNINKETGNKQLCQSTIKAGISALGFTLAEAGTKTLVKKGLGKLVKMLATKASGKLIGTALGSVIPGIGNIAGLLIGTLVDVALSRWVIPALFPTDVVTNEKIESADKEQLVEMCRESMRMGVTLDDTTRNSLAPYITEEDTNMAKMTDAERKKLMKDQQKALAEQQQALAEQQQALAEQQQASAEQ